MFISVSLVECSFTSPKPDRISLNQRFSLICASNKNTQKKKMEKEEDKVKRTNKMCYI